MPDDDLLTRLATAVIDPDPVPVTAAVAASARRRRRRRAGGVITAAVAVLALVLPLTLTRGGGHRRVVVTRPAPGPSAPSPTGPGTSTATSAGVTATISVPQRTVPAGGTLQFTVTVTNATGAPIRPDCPANVLPCRTAIMQIYQPEGLDSVRPPTPKGWTWTQSCRPRCLEADQPIPTGTTTTTLTIATSTTPVTTALILNRYLNNALPEDMTVKVATTRSSRPPVPRLPNPFIPYTADHATVHQVQQALTSVGLAPLVEQRFDAGSMTGELAATKPDAGMGVPAGSTVVVYDFITRGSASGT